MGADLLEDELSKNRPALTDVTNRKREFSLLSGKVGLKSRKGYHENVDCEHKDSQSAKQVCVRVEKCETKLVVDVSENDPSPAHSEVGTSQENNASAIANLPDESREASSLYETAVHVVQGNLVGLKSGEVHDENVDRVHGDSLVVDGSEKDTCPTHSEVGTLQENIASVVANLPDESKEASSLFESTVHVVEGDIVLQSVVEVGDALRDRCISSISMPRFSEICKKAHCRVRGKSQDEEGGLTYRAIQREMKREELVSLICKDSENDLSVGKLASRIYGSTEWLRLPKSKISKFHELGRCTGLKGDGCAGSNAGADSLKGCSCSFCTKVAFIWSDLHYQDIKGRIGALKKSQKEASILVQQILRGKEIEGHGQGNCNKLSKLEPDLTGNWRSLFLHTEDILVRERNQLQANFIALEDLRDDCKTELEMLNGKASKEH